MTKSFKGFGENPKEEWKDIFRTLKGQILQKRLDDCEDYAEYQRRFNRHTLKISLINEQTNTRNWVNHGITFFNEDNAIFHLSLLGDFLDLLLQEENRGWGYKKTPDELVDRIINPLRDRLKGKVACGDDDGIGERLSQLLYEEEEN